MKKYFTVTAEFGKAYAVRETLTVILFSISFYFLNSRLYFFLPVFLLFFIHFTFYHLFILVKKFAGATIKVSFWSQHLQKAVLKIRAV